MTDSISSEGFKTTRNPTTQTQSAMGRGRVIPTGNPSSFEESGDRAKALLKKRPNSTNDAKLGDVLSLSMFEAALSLVQDSPADGDIASSIQKSFSPELQSDEPKGESILSLIERMPSGQSSQAMSDDLSSKSLSAAPVSSNMSDQTTAAASTASQVLADEDRASEPLNYDPILTSDTPLPSSDTLVPISDALVPTGRALVSTGDAPTAAVPENSALTSADDDSSSARSILVPQSRIPVSADEDRASGPLNYDPILTSDTPLPSSDTLVPISDALVPTGGALVTPGDDLIAPESTLAGENKASEPENSTLTSTDNDSSSARSILVPQSKIPVSADENSQSMSDESTQAKAAALTNDDRFLMSDRSVPLSDSHLSTTDEWRSRINASTLSSQAPVTNSDETASQSTAPHPADYAFVPTSGDQMLEGNHQKAMRDASALDSDAPTSTNYTDEKASSFADSDLSEQASSALSTRGGPGSKASITPSSDGFIEQSAQSADDQLNQTTLPNQKVSDNRESMSSSESAPKEETSIDEERSDKNSNERSRRSDLQPALLVNGQPESTAILAASNTQRATGAERVDAVEKIISQMVSAVAQIEQLGRTDTVINLNQPPQFRGVQLVVSEFDSASRELNLTFANVQSPQVQRWLDDPSNAQKLRSGLSEVGFVVQRIDTTHEIDSRLLDQSSYQDQGDQSSWQGADQQRSGPDEGSNFAQSEES